MRSFLVTIDGVKLSDNGTDFTIPCSLEIPDFDLLKVPHVGITSFTASGKALTTVAPSRSVEFEIKVVKLKAPVYQQLLELAFANLSDQATADDLADVGFTVEITGATMDESTSFEAVFSPAKPVTKQSFINSHFFGINLRLIKI